MHKLVLTMAPGHTVVRLQEQRPAWAGPAGVLAPRVGQRHVGRHTPDCAALRLQSALNQYMCSAEHLLVCMCATANVQH